MKDTRRFLLFIGDGKGKTTAALGMTLRAVGHGMRVLFLQFIKADTSTGEIAAVRNLPGVEFAQMGRGFAPPPTDPGFADHRAAAEEGLRRASAALQSRNYDLVVLDEVCTAVSLGLLEEQQVERVVELAPPGLCLVLTGRSATERLISLADTVTEMRCVKHGFDDGCGADKGVEY